MIVARFVWIFPATYLPRWLSPSLARARSRAAWQAPFLVGFTGIRGIVSLAAALAIPLATASGEPFPHRDLILFLTFSVILVTLVGQGLLLPRVIRWLGLADLGRAERALEAAEEIVEPPADDRGGAAAPRRARERAAAARADRRALARPPPRAAAAARLPDRRRRASSGSRELSDELERWLIDAERRAPLRADVRAARSRTTRGAASRTSSTCAKPSCGTPRRAAGTSSPRRRGGSASG